MKWIIGRIISRGRVFLALLVFAFFVLLGFSCFSGAFTVFADSIEPPYSYIIEVEGGEKIFYMTVPGEEDEDNLASGLYYSNGENIYLIDGPYPFYSEGGMVLSSDGLSFAHLPWASCRWTPKSKDLSGTAIMFYNNGKLQKSYLVSELLKDPSKGAYTASHVRWENNQERSYDPTTNTLFVEAKDKTQTTFNLSNGKIISVFNPNDVSNPNLIYYIIGGIVLLIVISLVVVLLIKRKRKQTKAK